MIGKARIYVLGDCWCPIALAQQETDAGRLTARERMEWSIESVASPGQLVAFAVSSAFTTGRNQPREFGPGWAGFGKRFETRLFTSTAENVLEAGVGTLWAVDPRYHRRGTGPFLSRMGHVWTLTLATQPPMDGWFLLRQAHRGSLNEYQVEFVAAGERTKRKQHRSPDSAGSGWARGGERLYGILPGCRATLSQSPSSRLIGSSGT